MTPIGVLADIGDELVDLHGQHDHQSLLKTDRQLDLLDGYAGLENLVEDIREKVAALRSIEREIETLEQDDRDRMRRIEFLRFEVREIEDARLAPTEEEEVRTRLNVLNNVETIFHLSNSILGTLCEAEEGAAVDTLGAAERDLEALAGIDSAFEPLCQQLTESRSVLSKPWPRKSATTPAAWNSIPTSKKKLNQRLTLIGGLKRKYGSTIEDILAYGARAAEELAGLENHDARLDALRAGQRPRHEGRARSRGAALEKRGRPPERSWTSK